MSEVLQGCQQAMGAARMRLASRAVVVITEGASKRTGTIDIKGLSFRSELTDESGTNVAVISNGAGSRATNGMRRAMSPHTSRFFLPETVPALYCMLDRQKWVTATEGTPSDAATFELRVNTVPRKQSAESDAADQALSEFRIFINAKDFTVTKARKFIFSPEAIENRSQVDITYSDYRNVDGVLIPFLIKYQVNGQTYRTITVKSFAFTDSISDEEFSIQ